MHAAAPDAMMHGFNGFLLLLACVWAPMIIGLIQVRAPVSEFLKTPPVVLIVLAVAWLITYVLSLLLGAVGITSEMLLKIILAAVGGVHGYLYGLSTAYHLLDTGSYRRGAVVSDARWSSARRARRSDPVGVGSDPGAAVTLAGIRMAAADETKHFKFIGTTGTGKSTAIREMLNGALARGDRAVIADPDGGYLNHFYNPERGDVILNPFEPDSMKWNLLSEITKPYDVDQLARSLIPDSGGSDRIWSEYARTFFSAVLRQAMAGKAKDDGEIYRLLTKAPLKELKVLLGGSIAGPFLEDGNEKMFGSVRSVTGSAVRALDYTTQQRAAPFSVRQWVRQGAARCNGGQGGVLFLPYKAGEIASLRSVISAWMRIAIFEAMDRPEGDQRLWFVVDELDALGEIDGLKDALARLRKFGGRCVLGFQSISQVSSTYGKGVADTIVENCGNTLILRCSASEQGGTSQFSSRLIGQREVMRTTDSRTWRPNDWFASKTTSEHRTIEPAVMASEIERLPDLQGLLKFASLPDWRRVRLTPVSYPSVERVRRAEQAGVAEAAWTPAPVPPEPAPSPAKLGSVNSRPPLRQRSRKSPGKTPQSDAFGEADGMDRDATVAKISLGADGETVAKNSRRRPKLDS